jgi:hypothetical protein
MTITRTAEGAHGAASATYSDDEAYRYRLTRRWDDRPLVAFVMLNPSTATEEALDPTLRRCLGFARREGMGGFTVVNLFALRATKPKVMLTHPEPIGPENDAIIDETVADVQYVIAGWGRHGEHLGRGNDVLARLVAASVDVYRLGPATATGQPGHPLYLPGDSPLVRHV